MVWHSDALRRFSAVPVSASADRDFPRRLQVSVDEEHQHAWTRLPEGMEDLY